MKRVLFGLFLCGALCCQVCAADTSLEAVRCFEWFKTLGYPDLTHAPLAEVWTGRHWMKDDRQEFSTELGFVISDDKDQFTTISFFLSAEKWTKTGTEVPEYERVGYKELDLPKIASGVLNNARHASSGFVPAGVSGPQDEHRLWSRLNVFFLAVACYEKGEKELAGDLFEEAKKLYSIFKAPDDVEGADRMRVTLEMELAHEAALKTYEMIGGSNGSLPSRKEVLESFREVLQKFPHNPYKDRMQQMAALLEQMVREDAAHSPISDAALAELPPHEQAKEYIFRLRDVNSLSSRDPYSKKDTRGQLYLIGYDAVPLLIATLGDERPTRTRYYPKSISFGPPGVETIGECAEGILNWISGQTFGLHLDSSGRTSSKERTRAFKEEALAWWKKTRTDEEKEVLVKAVASGKLPVGSVERLKHKYPEAVEGAVLAGAAKANVRDTRQPDDGVWMENGYIEWVGQLKTKAATSFLVNQLTGGPWVITRVRAAQLLWEQHHPAVVPAMIQEWQKMRSSPTGPDTNDLAWLANFMVQTGQNAAVAALLSDFDRLSVDKKVVLVKDIGSYLQWKREHPELWSEYPAEPAALEAEEALLVHELEDVSLDPWRGRNDFVGSTPRVCDHGLWSLHQRDPQRQPCALVAGRIQRDHERLAAANTWRKEHQQPLLKIPQTELPSLPASESLKITSVEISPPQQQVPHFLEKILSLMGQKFSPDVMVRAVSAFTDRQNSKSPGCAIEAIRESDLSGVRLNVVMETEPPTQNRSLVSFEDVVLDGKSLYPAKEPDRELSHAPFVGNDWHALKGAISKLAESPPTAPFYVTVIFTAEPW